MSDKKTMIEDGELRMARAERRGPASIAKAARAEVRGAGASALPAEFDAAVTMLVGMAGECGESKRVAGGSVPEVAAGWVAPHYLLALQRQMASRLAGPDHFKLMQQAVRDVMSLQRGGIWAGRLHLEHERLELDRKKLQHKTSEAGQKKRDLNTPLTEAELKACVDKVDEIFGLKCVPHGPAKGTPPLIRDSSPLQEAKAEGGRQNSEIRMGEV